MPSINARAGVFLSFVTVALVGAAGCNSGVGPAAGSPSNRSGSCPNAQDTFSKMLPTTYAIGVAYELGNNELGYYSVGTAFAIDRRLLATNGHVARGVLDAGKQVRVVQAYAVQHGTGQVLELTRALIHPDYQTGKSTSTPDVALFTTKEEMTEWLDLATEEDVADIQPGDAVYATSFPGDVEKVAPVIPGQTVPQATALTGAITALRSYQQDVLVDATNTDIIQHQLPTSAGASGSAIVHCGKVIAANNAGTVKVIVSIDENGNLKQDRTTVADNNFGVHVFHLDYLVGLFRDNALQGEALPPAFDEQQANQNNADEGDATDGQGQAQQGVAAFAGTYDAHVGDPDDLVHDFVFTVSSEGNITGTASWANGDFSLAGQVDATGNLYMADSDAQGEFAGGEYYGTVTVNGQASGTYEDQYAMMQGNWTATRQ